MSPQPNYCASHQKDFAGKVVNLQQCIIEFIIKHEFTIIYLDLIKIK